MITREQFVDWRDHPVTRMFLDEVRKKEHAAVELLVRENNEALRGFILAYREILNVDFEDMEDE